MRNSSEKNQLKIVLLLVKHFRSHIDLGDDIENVMSRVKTGYEFGYATLQPVSTK